MPTRAKKTPVGAGVSEETLDMGRRIIGVRAPRVRILARGETPADGPGFHAPAVLLAVHVFAFVAAARLPILIPLRTKSRRWWPPPRS